MDGVVKRAGRALYRFSKVIFRGVSSGGNRYEAACNERGLDDPCSSPCRRRRSRARPNCAAGCIDAQGAVLPGVTVDGAQPGNRACSAKRVAARTAPSSPAVSCPGTYEVAAELQGFKKFERRDLRLEVGKTVEHRREAGGRRVEETVNVTAESPLVDVTSKEIGGNITSETLVQLPSVNGNFVGFVGLLPGIVPSISTESFGSDSISVNGQDPRNNNYMLDGGNNNDDVIGQRAGTQARTPIEAIQEFQVITDQYDAEFGRTSGAIVNAVTKAGTNQLRGSAFGYLPGRQPDRRRTSSRRRRDWPSRTRSTSAGAARSAGRSSRTSCTSSAASSGSRSIGRTRSTSRRGPNLNGTRDHAGSRVEHDRPRRPSGQRQQHLQRALAARDVAADEPDHRRPPRSTAGGAREESDVDQTLSANLNSGAVAHQGQHAATDLDARERRVRQPLLQHQRPRPVEVPADAGVPGLHRSAGQHRRSARINDGIQVEETLAWFLPGKHGDHDIKFGAQYQYSGARQHQPGQPERHVLVRPQQRAVQLGEPVHLSGSVLDPRRRSEHVYEKAHYFAGFAQDKWRFNQRPDAQPRAALRPRGDSDRRDRRPARRRSTRSTRTTSRRALGLTYDLDGGKSVARGGYGRFFDKTHFELIGGLYTGTPFTHSFSADVPDGRSRISDRATASCRPIRSWSTGRRSITTLLNQLYPGGAAAAEHRRDLGQRGSPQCRYTDEITAGYERQLLADLAVSADYVHSQQPRPC